MIRKAKIVDAQGIQRLINHYAKEGKLLPRSLSEIYDNLRDFFIYEGENHQVGGVCALHICWEDLAEIRSLAVAQGERDRGVGRKLVEACLQEARQLGISRVFLLTYIPHYFSRVGFRVVDKSTLPHKIWGDCLRCVKFPNCDETAMIIDL
ncbi:MAG: N-acetyltransferase [Deltaproteobacteria bacterium]|nr:MAG: N-acetyltransferase [Deltaproteobacteria bacterium]